MNISETKKIARDVLAPFHFSSLEDAGFTMLYLSCLAKISEYKSDVQRFEKKYGLSFDFFKKQIDSKTNQECFEEEDDYMAWQYAYDALQYWEKKVQELDKCF